MIKKTLLALGLSTVMSLSASAQSSSGNAIDNVPVAYEFVAQKPAYPGGFAAAESWIRNKIQWKPDGGRELTFNVKLHCIVERDGKLTLTKASAPQYPGLREALKDVVSRMPAWTPGKQDGKTKRVPVVLDVELRFKAKPVESAKPVADKPVGARVDGTDDLSRVAIREEIVTDVKSDAKNDVYNFSVVEKKPEFPGGEAAMYAWLAQNIRYPAQAQEDGAQGKVVVQMCVNKDGSISDVKVIRGMHPALDKEAIRVVKAMPKWTPGLMYGNPVRVQYVLPITFKFR